MQEAFKKGLMAFDILDRSPKSLDFLFKVAHGHVGNQAATEFKGFIETDYQSLDANVILNKWDETIEKRIMDVVNANRIPELSSYNAMIVEYIKDKVKKDLNEKQSKNLASYCKTIPNEVCADFWKKFTGDCREIATKCYKESSVSDEVKSRIIGIFQNPKVNK
jgi:flagellar motor switch protein FliG